MSNYYVDLDASSSGLGTSGIPYKATDFFTAIASSVNGDVYNIKGMYSGAISPANLCSNTALAAVTLQAWPGFNNWRINTTTQIYFNNTGKGCTYLHDAIIYCSTIYISDVIANCIIKASSTAFYNGPNVLVIAGSVIYNLYIGNAIGPSTAKDSVITSVDLANPSGSHALTMTNCAYGHQSIGATTVNCQSGYYSMALPVWNDATVSDWYVGTILPGLSTPPEPGVGSPSYAGYATDLFGAVRTGIGTGSMVIPISASFSAAPTSGYAPLAVTFTDNSIGPTSWNWNFGDGVTSSTSGTFTHTYNTSGNFNVVLNINSSASSASNNINVLLPTANFSATPISGYSPLTVSFTDTSIDGLSWLWDFGDSVSSTNQNPSHTYTNIGISGSYNVTLSIDSAESVITKPNYINVFTLPSQPILISPLSGSSNNQPITFTWSASSNTNYYNLEYSTDPTFSSGVSSIPAISATQYTMSYTTTNVNQYTFSGTYNDDTKDFIYFTSATTLI